MTGPTRLSLRLRSYKDKSRPWRSNRWRPMGWRKWFQGWRTTSTVLRPNYNRWAREQGKTTVPWRGYLWAMLILVNKILWKKLRGAQQDCQQLATRLAINKFPLDQTANWKVLRLQAILFKIMMQLKNETLVMKITVKETPKTTNHKLISKGQSWSTVWTNRW